MATISKSKYTLFRKCGKCLWLTVKRPDLQEIDEQTQERFKNGTAVGDLAKKRFGEYTDVTALIPLKDDKGNVILDEFGNPSYKLDIAAMLQKTKDCIKSGTPVICEAAFSHDGCYCAVDLLRKTENGYAIYEVKSSTSADKEVYAQDVAFQKWVLTQCGLNITDTYLMCINSDYIRHGDLDVTQLFSINDIQDAVGKEYVQVAEYVRQAKDVLAHEEPDIAIGNQCQSPYACPFMNYCRQLCNFPDEPTVFDLYRIRSDKAIQMMHQGIVTFDQLDYGQLNDKQLIQVECEKSGRPHIDSNGIKDFLNTLKYPIYHLDFESIQPVIPPYDGSWPYEQHVTQFSLHIEQQDHSLTHKEWLGISGTDTRRAAAEALCAAIPVTGGCVMVYNKTFESARIKEMAEMYEDLRPHLESINSRIVDLIDPFRQFCCYYPAQHGSCSIKAVLPALFPNDPSLDYHNLEGCVHNGGEAMDIFPKIAFMEPDEAAATREALLRYCELDTMAMVKVLSKLRELAGVK